MREMFPDSQTKPMKVQAACSLFIGGLQLTLLLLERQEPHEGLMQHIKKGCYISILSSQDCSLLRAFPGRTVRHQENWEFDRVLSRSLK